MSYVNGERSTGGKHYSQSKGLKDQVRRQYNYTCQLCGGPGYDVDHIIPWAVSHDSTLANLRVLCHQCNVDTRRPRKDAKLPLKEWYEWIENELASAPCI